MKVCSKCKQELPATAEYFYRDNQKKDGLRLQCKKCRRKYHRGYYQKQKHKARYKKQQKEYCRKHRKQRKEYQRGYYRTIKGYLGVVYSGINRRCYNPKVHNYSRYGGRGIKNKFNSLDDFRDYVVNELGYDSYDKIKGLQIDRIDNDGHYQKGNIRFVTRSENNRNKRSNKS